MKHLESYIPFEAKTQIEALLANENVLVKVKSERKTKHGDYKMQPNGKHQITINSNLNPYRFLITLVHEIAHLKAYKTYGRIIKPHGKEWKNTFQHLMLPFLRPEIFPETLLPLLAQHFKNPKASSDTDIELALALKKLNTESNKTLVFEVEEGNSFQLYNGRIFRKGKTRRKRIECIEIKSGRVYLFNPNAEVELLE